MCRVKRVGLFKVMINLSRGIRFRYMVTFNVRETRLLLAACMRTLETLRLYPTDPCGEQSHLKHALSPANNLTARPSLPDFHLSRNKSLRALEVRTGSIIIVSRDIVRQTPPSRVSSGPYSRPSCPSCHPRSLSFIGTPTFVAWHPPPPDPPKIYTKTTPDQIAREASWHCG